MWTHCEGGIRALSLLNDFLRKRRIAKPTSSKKDGKGTIAVSSTQVEGEP